MNKTYDTDGYSIYNNREAGEVTSIIDPDNDGEIIVNSANSNYEFMSYITPYSGMYFPPDVGDIVMVEAEEGSVDYLFAHGILRGGLMDRDSTDEKKGQGVEIPEQFRRRIPTNRGLITPGDLMNKSQSSAARLHLGHPAEKFGGHAFEMDDGIATISNTTGDITMTTEKKGVRITTSAGNKIQIYEEESDVMSPKNYINIEATDGNYIRVNITDNKITIDAPNIELGEGALQKIMRGDKFKQLWTNLTDWLAAHTHGTAVGPSSNPLVAMTPYMDAALLGASLLTDTSKDVFSQVHTVD